MSDQIKAGLTPHFPEQLVDELLSAYREAKHNFLLGGLRLSAVEGGRFCEAALRMLEHAATGTFTSLNSQINTDGIIRNLSNLPRGNFSDSIRLHLPESHPGHLRCSKQPRHGPSRRWHRSKPTGRNTGGIRA